MSTDRTARARSALIAPLRVPVVCAPMFLVSGPEMVIAACRAGIVGAFPATNARPIETLEAWLDQVSRSHATGPTPRGAWALNVMSHASNTRLADELALIARYRPPVVITALGSPKPVIEVVHGYGGVVIADVINLTLARKAVAAGADGLACICAGAGGHTGTLSPFAFVGAVREFFDGLIVLGGGIGDGFGVAGAIAAGADLVYMGTRFIASTESLASPAYRQMVVDADIDDLVISASITGTAASWLAPSLVALGLDPGNLPPAPERNYDANRPISARRWVDTWSAGQGVGRIRRVAPVAEIVAEIADDYAAACARFAALGRSGSTAPTPDPRA